MIYRCYCFSTVVGKKSRWEHAPKQTCLHHNWKVERKGQGCSSPLQSCALMARGLPARPIKWTVLQPPSSATLVTRLLTHRPWHTLWVESMACPEDGRIFSGNCRRCKNTSLEQVSRGCFLGHRVLHFLVSFTLSRGLEANCEDGASLLLWCLFIFWKPQCGSPRFLHPNLPPLALTLKMWKWIFCSLDQSQFSVSNILLVHSVCWATFSWLIFMTVLGVW